MPSRTLFVPFDDAKVESIFVPKKALFSAFQYPFQHLIDFPTFVPIWLVFPSKRRLGTA